MLGFLPAAPELGDGESAALAEIVAHSSAAEAVSTVRLCLMSLCFMFFSVSFGFCVVRLRLCSKIALSHCHWFAASVTRPLLVTPEPMSIWF